MQVYWSLMLLVALTVAVLFVTVDAAHSRYCKKHGDCKKGEFCRKPSIYATGIKNYNRYCAPLGDDFTRPKPEWDIKRRDPGIKYPNCETDYDCREDEICYVGRCMKYSYKHN